MSTWTCVEISFFKPTGFEARHYVETEHRGAAIDAVMETYNDHHRMCINTIVASLCNGPRSHGRGVVTEIMDRPSDYALGFKAAQRKAAEAMYPMLRDMLPRGEAVDIIMALEHDSK